MKLEVQESCVFLTKHWKFTATVTSAEFSKWQSGQTMPSSVDLRHCTDDTTADRATVKLSVKPQ